MTVECVWSDCDDSAWTYNILLKIEHMIVHIIFEAPFMLQFTQQDLL